ncbi:hypothetical protein HanPSC8_Chr12g0514781 [Helianthus annuus]|nr:hypothetical protein HanPSC8_Chr12g0514781 [Helianthus annuus]
MMRGWFTVVGGGCGGHRRLVRRGRRWRRTAGGYQLRSNIRQRLTQRRSIPFKHPATIESPRSVGFGGFIRTHKTLNLGFGVFGCCLCGDDDDGDDLG